jgi:hypothetical protein
MICICVLKLTILVLSADDKTIAGKLYPSPRQDVVVGAYAILFPESAFTQLSKGLLFLSKPSNL